MAKQTTRTDVMQTITDSVVKMLESGEADPKGVVYPWRRVGITARNALTGKAYKGLNRWLFAAYTQEYYDHNIWGTGRQFFQLGLVKKDDTQQAVMGVKWNIGKLTAAEEAAKARGEKVRTPGMWPKPFFVYNIGQMTEMLDKDTGQPVKPGAIDRIIARVAPAAAALTENEVNEAAQHAQDVLKATGIKLVRGGDDCYFDNTGNKVKLPASKAFDSQVRETGAMAHEFTHATGHKSRLDRETLRDYHQDITQRAREELTAELGCTLTLQYLGVEPTTWEGHVNYLANWITLLKDDKNALTKCASQAEKAFGWLLEAAGVERAEDGQADPDAPTYDAPAVEVEKAKATVRKGRTSKAKEVAATV